MPSARPKYSLIADQLMREIREGSLPVGGKLPTENQLMRAYGVSRHTVRNAVQDLRARGVVSSRQGQGHNVVAAGVDNTFAETIQSIDELITFGQETRRVLIGQRMLEADQAHASLFGCTPGRRLAEVRMLRKMLGRTDLPIAVVTLWIDALLEPVIRDLEEIQKSASEIIRDRFGYVTRSVVQTIQAERLDGECARIFGSAPGEPALTITRTYAQAKDGEPFLIARSICRADMFRVVSRFSRAS